MFGHGLGGCGFYGMGTGMWFLPLVFGVIIVIGILVFTRINAKSTRTNHALRILDERYARGELTQEEYEHYKDTLH